MEACYCKVLKGGTGTGWDLGPLLQGLHLDTRLLQQQIQRNYKGLKITACMRSWGKLWTRYKKTKNPNCHVYRAQSKSRRSGARAGYACAPCTQHHKGVGRPPKAPLRAPPDTPLPSPHIRNQLAPPRGASKGTCYWFSLPASVAGIPLKPCLNFFSGPDQFLLIKEAKNPGRCQT